MKTFKQFIIEIFDSNYEWQWSKTKKKYWLGEFKTDQHLITIVFNEFKWKNKIQWEITFDTDGSEDITGTGRDEQFKIFSTIFVIMKDFVKKINPDFLYFTAKEPSRISLYNTFLKLSKHKLKAKEVKKIKAYNNEGHGYLIIL